MENKGRLSLEDFKSVSNAQVEASVLNSTGGQNEASVEKWYDLGQTILDWLLDDCHPAE